ncbi:MAG: DUF2634 domain-containing protein [bacterium]|nr:DUF2634 domain-containing protein [bacterium]
MKNTYAFDFTKNEFTFENGDVLTLTGISALKLWVEETLRTQAGRYGLYRGKEYGANIEEIGKSYKYDFAESELKREIENALLRHDDVQSADSFSVTKQGTVLNISFTLTTSYGEETLSYDIG